MPSFNSAVQICNYALNRIGHNAIITDLTESSTAATQCNLVYDKDRVSLLTAHDWGFVRKDVALVQAGTPPTYWDYSYQYPGDALKVVKLYDQTWKRNSDTRRIDYEIALTTVSGVDTNVVYTDLQAARMTYTTDSENPQVWPQYFVDALYMRIAASICLGMTGDQGLTREVEQQATLWLDNAKRQDNEQGADSADWYEAKSVEARN